MKSKTPNTSIVEVLEKISHLHIFRLWVRPAKEQ